MGKGGDILLVEQVRGRHGMAGEGKGWGDALPRRARSKSEEHLEHHQISLIGCMQEDLTI